MKSPISSQDNTTNDALFAELMENARRSKKYRVLELPEELMLDILRSESRYTSSRGALEKAFRNKLHNVIAPYLEDIDYARETQKLSTLIDSNPDEGVLRDWASGLMSRHASSRERLPVLHQFYQDIFNIIGTPTSLIDLACALDPLALPWMNLPNLLSYLAFDINKPRVDFLNVFFSNFFPQAHAIQQDVLASPPSIKADCAFFLKEAHRFEKRRAGSNRYFFENLNVDFLVVSLPASDLNGHHSLEKYHNEPIRKAIAGFDWPCTQIQVGDELIYLINKQ